MPHGPSTAPSEACPAADSARWFRDEVHPHDGQLKAYLRGQFPAVRDVEDVVQESYLRIWKAKARMPIESARAFLFKVARNVALDLIRRHRRQPLEDAGEAAVHEVPDERPGVAETAIAHERIRLLADALDALTPRHRQIVILCKLQGRSHRDVAAELGLSERTVTEHVYRAVQRLGEELQRRGVIHFGS